MKKRFNFLTVAAFAVLLINFVSGFVYSFSVAYNMVSSIGNDDVKAIRESTVLSDNTRELSLDVIPVKLWKTDNTLVNSLTGEQVPAAFSQAVIFVDDNGVAPWYEPLIYGGGVIQFILCIAVIWLFVKFILCINRMEIFTWKNVSLLRWIGMLIIGVFAVKWLVGLGGSYVTSQIFVLDGYAIDWFRSFDSVLLVLGVLSLIVAEVFAMGLKQREELELTI